MGGEWFRAMRLSAPIGLGYYAVSFAFGLSAAQAGVPPMLCALMSLSSLSSSGQFAGLTVLAARGGMGELFVSVLIVNLRYMLMSLSLSQKIAPMPVWQKLLISHGVTDEVYALATREEGRVSFSFYAGLMALPVAGWTLGTLSGALLGQVLPPALTAALGIALYCMFIWIVLPPAMAHRDILRTVLAAAGLSVLLAYAPLLRALQAGWRITLASLASALFSACLDARKGESA